MTAIPTVGVYRSADHTYWHNGEGPFPGATSIIKIIDKSAPLMGWAQKVTAEFAVDNLPWVTESTTLIGRDETVKLIKARARAEKDAGAALGTEIHTLVEGVARGIEPELTEQQFPYVEAYRRWLVEYSPKLISLEKACFNPSAGYAGTFDIIADLDGVRWLIDVKTNRASGQEPKPGMPDNRGIYSEVSLQLAAYANATFIGLPGDPRKFPMPRTSRYAVLHLRPDAYDAGYRFVEISVTSSEYRAFLDALSLTRWRREREWAVIGNTVPVKEAVA